MARGADTRARLLDAAVVVVRRDGAQALTLEAVAAQAGVSKGGLLYHFPSKRELLDAMVAGWLDEFDSEIAAASGDGPGAFAGGYVRATDMSGWAAADRATEFGFLAALVDQPRMQRVRERYGGWQARLVAESAD
ncbi:MAG: TetR/AcrR family transcriptional regulator, partial [Solirubrobacteraceae bacterium]